MISLYKAYKVDAITYLLEKNANFMTPCRSMDMYEYARRVSAEEYTASLLYKKHLWQLCTSPEFIAITSTAIGILAWVVSSYTQNDNNQPSDNLIDYTP